MQLMLGHFLDVFEILAPTFVVEAHLELGSQIPRDSPH
jgi:hypothetical protein